MLNRHTQLYGPDSSFQIDHHIDEINKEGWKLLAVTSIQPYVNVEYHFFWEKSEETQAAKPLWEQHR